MAKVKKSTAWRQYQEDAAALFRSLGFEADVESPVSGARASHAIDVLVTVMVAGVRVRWIVECKRWKSRVKKEQVMALAHIAQDVGADRAILLSESGFQAGALAAARHTSVTLTSLDELRDAARADIQKARLAALFSKNAALEERLRGFLFNRRGEFPAIRAVNIDSVAGALGACLAVNLALTKATVGAYPISVSSIMTDEPDARYDDPDPLLDHLERLTGAVEARASEIDVDIQNSRSATLGQVRRFLDEVAALLDLSEAALLGVFNDDESSEAARLRCVASMQRIREAAEAFRSRLDGAFFREYSALMRLLIDTLYLDLARPTVTCDHWVLCRSAIETQKARVEAEYARASTAAP